MSWTTTKDFAELLSREGQLSSPVADLILDLRKFQYEMADEEDQEVRSTTATTYVAAAANVTDALRALPDDQP
jgi:hypothetical protein